MGSPDEEEEAHWTILEGFRNLAGRSLQTLLHILTKDLPHAIEVCPYLFSYSRSPFSFREGPWNTLFLL
jgi:hypothetical protein